MLQGGLLGDAAEAGDAHLVGNFAQHLLMPLAAHLIKYHARDAHVRTKMQEALQQGGHGVGCGARIDHEHHGQVQHSSHLRAGAEVAVVAVEEPHHTLDHSHVGRPTRPLWSCCAAKGVAAEEFTDVVWRSHERVEVHARAAADGFVELGVDVIRPAFEGLDAEATLHKKGHQTTGNGGLATAAGGCCYEECCFHRAQRYGFLREKRKKKKRKV